MDQDAIWDYFQNEAAGGAAFAGSETRLGYLARLIPVPGHVLNIGVGAGVFEAQASARGLTVYSLDPNAKSIERLRTLYGAGDRARVGYSQQIPFPDSHFDAVVLSEVLEHLSDEVLSATLHEVRRVLKGGGQLVGTVPARERLSDDTVVCPHCTARFHRWGHVQEFDRARMKALLSVHFENIRTWERPFVPLAYLNWKGKVQGLARLVLYFFGVHGQHENMVFIARKPSQAG